MLNLVLNENYYTLLLGLDGEAALGNVQNAYKLYDEDGNLLNERGEIEEAAYRYFMENSMKGNVKISVLLFLGSGMRMVNEWSNEEEF